MQDNFILKILGKISKYIEYILLILTIIITLFIYIKGYFSFFFIFIFTIFGVFTYLRLKPQLPDIFINKNLSINIKANRIYSISGIIFWVFFSLSIFSLLFTIYSKNFVYFVSIGICTAITALQILLVSSKGRMAINLLQSFFITLNITLSNQIIFPDGIGLPDTGLHFDKIVMYILDTGFIPTNVVNYTYFPYHHLFSSVGILLAGSEAKITYFCLGGFIVSLGIFFVYLIATRIVNQEFGLFCAVLFPTLDYYIMYGSHPEHQAFNFALSIVFFAVILLFYFSNDKRFMILSTILMISMVFTHHFSAVIILIILGSLLIVELFKKNAYPSYIPRFFPLVSIFGIVLLIQWIYYSNIFGSFIGILTAYQSAFQNINVNVVSQSAYDTIPLITIFVNSLGSGVLILFASVGCILFCKERDIIYHFIIAIAITTSFLLGIGLLFKQVGLLPDRLYPYLQIFSLVFLGAAGFRYCIGKIKSNRKKAISIFVIIFFLSFFSYSSTIAGFETSLFVDENLSYYKLFSTPQERFFLNWQHKTIGENINLLEIPLTSNGLINTSEIPDKSYISFNNLFLKTGFIRHTGYHMGEYQFIKIKQSEIQKMDVFERLYSNGIVINYRT